MKTNMKIMGLGIMGRIFENRIIGKKRNILSRPNLVPMVNLIAYSVYVPKIFK